MNAIRVLVVDDQRLVRDGIASLLDIQDGIEVVGQADDGQVEAERVLMPLDRALSDDADLLSPEEAAIIREAMAWRSSRTV